MANKISIKSLLNKFFKYLIEELSSKGVDVDEVKQESDGSITYTLSFIYKDQDEPVEIEFYMNGKPVDDENKFVNLSFKAPDPDDLEKYITYKNKYTNVENSQEAVLKACMKFIDEMYGVDTLENVPSDLAESQNILTSTQVARVSLIKANNEVKVTKIVGNYSATDLLNDVNMLIDNTAETLPENEISVFDIFVDDKDNCINILPCENLDESEYEVVTKCCGYDAILKAAYKLYLDACNCDYLAFGAKFDTIKSYSQNYRWLSQEMINTISKWIVEDNMILDHPGKIVSELYNEIDISCVQKVEWEMFKQLMQDNICHLVDVLECYVPNYSKDKQQILYDMIRNWRYELRYNLDRQ